VINNIYEAILLLFKFDREIYSIILLSIIISMSSVILASVFSIPLGVFIGSINFCGKKLFVRIINTLMGLPPVVAGLVVYMFLSKSGPLGSLQLLFTPFAMIIAQMLIIFPIITALTITAVEHKKEAVWETCRGIGLTRVNTLLLLLRECRSPIVSALLAGYGRSVSEVGAIMLVGGNIQYHTRVMTTAVVLETGKGNYDRALAIGMVLIIIAFLVNWLLQSLLELEAGDLK
jgi:tungstate transport system permease protein